MAEQEKEPLNAENAEASESSDQAENKAEFAQADVGAQTLQQQLDLKAKELEEAANKYQRLYADFDNFRRRSQKEKEEAAIIVGEAVLQEFLPVMDNFERALTGSSEDAAAFRTGVEMIFKQFSSVFEKLGVQSIEALNQSFDPQYHQAVMREDDPDQPDGLIVQELQKGYQYKGHVMRPSMVKVVSHG